MIQKSRSSALCMEIAKSQLKILPEQLALKVVQLAQLKLHNVIQVTSLAAQALLVLVKECLFMSSQLFTICRKSILTPVTAES
jgi:hypothetical protein